MLIALVALAAIVLLARALADDPPLDSRDLRKYRKLADRMRQEQFLPFD